MYHVARAPCGWWNYRHRAGSPSAELNSQGAEESRLVTGLARERNSILRGKNLFLSLSFLGVVVLGGIFLGFWYLVTPRLAEIYAGLPAIVGIALVGTYLAVVALFSLIVMSTYFQRDFISAKKITVRILFPLAQAIGAVFRILKDEIRGSFVEVNNSLVRASSRLVAGDSLLLLLPHCLQSFECPHRVTSEVRNCRRCGGCEISDLIAMCDAYGINMSIATGGTLARRVIVETRPKAIVAVACERDLTSGIQDAYPIPVIGVLNERPYGPCRDTRVDIAKVEEAISFFLGRRSADSTGKTSGSAGQDVAVIGADRGTHVGP